MHCCCHSSVLETARRTWESPGPAPVPVPRASARHYYSSSSEVKLSGVKTRFCILSACCTLLGLIQAMLMVEQCLTEISTKIRFLLFVPSHIMKMQREMAQSQISVTTLDCSQILYLSEGGYSLCYGDQLIKSNSCFFSI